MFPLSLHSPPLIPPDTIDPPIILLPLPILTTVLSLSLPVHGSSCRLLSLSTVCKTFRTAINSSLSHSIDTYTLEKLSNFFSSEKDFNTHVSKLLLLTPCISYLKFDSTIPPNTLHGWSKTPIGKTLRSLHFDGLDLPHLELLPKFEVLEHLNVTLSFEHDWLSKLKYIDPLLKITKLGMFLAKESDPQILKSFLDLFPNLKKLEIVVSRFFHASQGSCTIDHSNLESLEIGIVAPFLSIICPKLVSLRVCILPSVKLDIESTVSLKKLDCGGSSLSGEIQTKVEMPKGNKCELTHLKFDMSTNFCVIETLLLSSSGSLMGLVVSTIEPLVRFNGKRNDFGGLFELPSLSELNVEDIKLVSTRMDDFGKEVEEIDDRLFPVLNLWLSICPALKKMTFTFAKLTFNFAKLTRSPTVELSEDKKNLLSFMEIVKELKTLYPKVTFRCPGL